MAIGSGIPYVCVCVCMIAEPGYWYSVVMRSEVHKAEGVTKISHWVYKRM
jgi:hypothetical protein